MRFRRSDGPRIFRSGGGYVVRFADGTGREHEEAFDTRRRARRFARTAERWPSGEAYDREETAQLTAEYTGSFIRFGELHEGMYPRPPRAR